MTTGIYEDRVLGAPDVCSNCFSLIKLERVDQAKARQPIAAQERELASTYERDENATTVEHGPGEEPAHCAGVFCECGVESARERLWSDGDVDRNRFKSLLKALVRTLERKDVDLRKDETAAYALAGYDADGVGIDEALATAVDAGVVAAINS